MGNYLFQGEDVYVAVNGGMETMPVEECAALLAKDDDQARVLIAAADGDALMQQVRRVRQIFPVRGIKTLVPYAAALRLSLQRRGVLSAGQGAIVADDLGDRFLLTVMKDHQAVHTRAISMTDPVKVVEEIRRTQKSVVDGAGALPKEPVLRILSNNPHVIEALDPARRKEAVLFDGSFPAFEVLGRVKFAYALMTPEEAAQQKRRALRRGMVFACSLGMCLAGLGTVFFLHVAGMEKQIDHRMSGLQAEKAALEQQVRELSAAVYRTRLRQWPQADLAGVFGEVLLSVPPEGKLESVLLERGTDRAWGVEADIVFVQQRIMPLLGNEFWKGAGVRHVFIQDKPALSVSRLLADERSLP